MINGSRVNTKYQTRNGQSSDQSRCVFGSGFSAFYAASERGNDKDAGAYVGGLETAEEDRQVLGGPTSMCSAIPSSTRGSVVDGEG